MATYLGLDVITIAILNLVLQTVAYFILIIGFRFARKNNFRKHGIMMSTAILLNFISLFIVMLSSFYSVISALKQIELNPLIIILHHSFGVITLVMAIIAIITLRPCGSIRGNQKLGNVRKFMITLFTFWSITYFLGIIVYLMLYTAFFS
jgi:uncharacterized membrane protein YozB (DUF420 family)